ncbi:cation-translocating P-type ATPase [Streptomyces ipomoeae]|uniref:cation-translocating P-type ATPase n=1 Tax=Streptomyces ipomoeae TaxID=103232 RepID=UPI00215BC340|nr:cation-translocating P-type ATPase [Streptomyces ipomoeae]MDX2820311.1 cation-translocating P-type ATPase [Streptomyces ipomoeae]MDX2872892.1 cation-translocating P-type ATPase [Streptomyces ipomoeae]
MNRPRDSRTPDADIGEPRGATPWAGPSGLSSDEAARRLEFHGPNEIPAEPRIPVWRRVLQQLRDPLILVLLVAAALTIATGDLSDAAVILLVITVNTVVGVVQEVRAEQAVMALSAMSAPAARVVRDGEERSIPAAEVVPGDLVLVAEGDIVPADGDVLAAALLLADESSLTGESVPVEKAPDQDASRGAVSAGTIVVRGHGRVVVTATGADSALGRIAALMGAAPGLTPLQHRLARFGRTLAAAIVALCAVVLALGLVRGQPVELMIVAAISLAVAAVPESLPAVVTLALALGARRMADRHAIVRRLPAVETLGSVTVIATDKTGTLTEGRMAAEQLWTPYGEAAVVGTGYEPEGQVVRDGEPVIVSTAPDLAELLRAAMLCNDAALEPPPDGSTEWSALGDPTEAALLVAGARLGLDRGALDRGLPRLEEIPFDSGRKRMTTIHRRPEGGVRVACKGAPESVLQPQILTDRPDVIAQAAAQAEVLARCGYRVLAIASADHQDTAQQPPTWESGLSLLGLVGILDPPRSTSESTISACKRAGIVPVLITGDHPLTARAVAGRLGIAARDEEVTTGDRIREGTAGDLTDVRVYARTTPEQKLDIVQAWRGAGHVVAMTGDGVNDGPALRQADIGVAMGRRGTEVARQAADLVLADDNPAMIVSAVEEGRRVYANVRRFLLYGLAGGTAEILVMLLGPFLGMPLPLLPAQILWINLLTHGLPGVALGAEPVDPDTMRHLPRPPEESVLGAGLWPRILFMGAFVATVTLVVGVWARETGRPWQSMIFLILGATQLGVALGSRARPGSLANPFLLVAVGAALSLQVAGVYLPPLQELLGTEPLPPTDLAIACAVSGLGHVVMRLQARLKPERPPRGGPPEVRER